MNREEEYNKCEDKILLDYQFIKDSLQPNELIICQHIGTFKQDILISIVSLVDNLLTQQGESIKVKKKLIYIIIECIQNIMFHSNKLPENHQLAYFLLIKNNIGYSLYACNSLETEKIYALEAKINHILNVKTDLFTSLFEKKLKQFKPNESESGGIGLITMIEKSGKQFSYKISTVSENYSIFNLEFKIKNT